MSLLDLSHASAALVLHRGEATVRSLATQALELYRNLDDTDRRAFFRFMLDEMSPDPGMVDAAITAYRDAPSASTLAGIANAVEPVRQEFLRRLNTAPGATRQIVAMRSDLLDQLRSEPDLGAVDADFLHLLNAWFNRGFLEIRRLDWSTPAFVLEKLIEYEAVHEIRGWSDLQRRLGDDRRLYAYFHPSLPDEPIIFVEVALTEGLAGSVSDLLRQPAPDTTRESLADTAIFYSITNTQPGLKGISFGNFLIKQVMTDLGSELPQLRRFSTLSPVPGFVGWLKQVAGTAELDWMAPDVAARLAALDDPSWIDFPELVAAIRPSLERACAGYLLHAKAHDGTTVPRDPVARFHLRNGARLQRLNWMGDTSRKGLRESAGMLVNYVYDPERIEENMDAYAARGVVDVDPDLAAVAAGSS